MLINSFVTTIHSPCVSKFSFYIFLFATMQAVCRVLSPCGCTTTVLNLFWPCGRVSAERHLNKHVHLVTSTHTGNTFRPELRLALSSVWTPQHLHMHMHMHMYMHMLMRTRTTEDLRHQISHLTRPKAIVNSFYSRFKSLIIYDSCATKWAVQHDVNLLTLTCCTIRPEVHMFQNKKDL